METHFPKQKGNKEVWDQKEKKEQPPSMENGDDIVVLQNDNVWRSSWDGIVHFEYYTHTCYTKISDVAKRWTKTLFTH